MSKALLYDGTVCIGCKQCAGACAAQNKLSYSDAVASEEVQSEHKFMVVLTKGDKFMRRLCMNCNDPACASVCPVGAATEDGRRTGYLRRESMPGLPVLHGGVPIQRSQVRMEQAASSRPEMHHVPGSRKRRQANRLRGDLSDRC